MSMVRPSLIDRLAALECSRGVVRPWEERVAEWNTGRGQYRETAPADRSAGPIGQTERGRA